MCRFTDHVAPQEGIEILKTNYSLHFGKSIALNLLRLNCKREQVEVEGNLKQLLCRG